MSNAPEAAQKRETTHPGKPGRIALALAFAIGLTVGGASGAIIAGPLLAKQVATSIAHTASILNEHTPADGDAPRAQGKDGDNGPATTPAVHTIPELVVNPANSGGTRFLMATVSIAAADSATVNEMKGRDPEVRHVVLSVLGKKTVGQLANIELRDSLSGELGVAIDSLLSRPAVRAVYFPQFIIQ